MAHTDYETPASRDTGMDARPTTDLPAQVVEHRVSAEGVLSRYAPHLMMWGVLLAIGLLLASLGVARPGAGTVAPGLLFLVGSFACLIPMFVGLYRGPRWGRTTRDGVEWQDGQAEHAWRWDEIAAVFRLDKIINQTFRVKQLRLVGPSGEVTFDQCLSDYERFADTVQNTVAARLLPAKRAELAGAGADFGPVTLHRDSITIEGKSFLWREIEQYIVFRGRLVLYPKSSHGIGCEEVALAAIPNYPVLLCLMQDLGQMPVPPQQSILFSGRK
jgi:hypothetical protein